MKGHIQRRGKQSWRLKFDAGRDPNTGERNIQYRTFRGSKRQAQTNWRHSFRLWPIRRLLSPNKANVAGHVRDRIATWENSGQISARTAARYRELLNSQIVPHIGDILLQKLRAADIERWHITLANRGKAHGRSGIAPRTVRHAHRVLSKAIKDAVTDDLVARNVASLKPPPKVNDDEKAIVRNIPALVEKLVGSRLEMPALIALFTGMRLGEILALRWGRIDLVGKVIQVRDAMEYTRAHGVRFKAPKTKAGRRDITLPDVLVDALQRFQRGRLEIGGGVLPGDALLFGVIYGDPPTPNAFSAAWRDFARAIGSPEINFHALRHTHASQLIDQNVDPVTISKRLGHAKPDITLRIYAHLFQKDDAKAADAINALWAKVE